MGMRERRPNGDRRDIHVRGVDSYDRLLGHLAGLESILLAYSGGVDSTLLMAAAHDAVGDRALAVTACSLTYPARERHAAMDLARAVGIRHRLIESRELDDPSFQANPVNRCFYCKRGLFRELRALADREGLVTVVDGSNADDRSDVRPGRLAGREYGVRSPLIELGWGKDVVRRLARERGLPNWNQPAGACLASRIPFGEAITPERLGRIAATEAALQTQGFRVIRVRDHGHLARIELELDDAKRVLDPEIREAIVTACVARGYTFVCLDLAGYRTGAMNEALPPEAIAEFREGTP